MGKIQYNYPVERLDDLISQIYDQGLTPLMTADLEAEVNLRYQELLHIDDDEDEEDSEYMDAKRKHEEIMKNIESERRKSHSRNVLIIELTDEEKEEIRKAAATSFVRSDPNSPYNTSDDDIAEDEEKRRIYRQLQTLGKVYYHQEDYRNAMNIIREAIEYSLKHDYPWLSYEEALKQFSEGRIRYTYAELPILYVDYNTQISDPKMLAGIVSGEITLVDKDSEPVKRKKVKSNPIEVPYTLITPAEHVEMAKLHQAGYDTPISTILKAKSTIYNRYVIPTSFTTGSKEQEQPQAPFDWMQPDAGKLYFEQMYGKKTNTISEIVTLLNENNDRKLSHTIGQKLREFEEAWKPEQYTFKTLSTSLEQHNEAVEIENRLLSLMRQTNMGNI